MPRLFLTGGIRYSHETKEAFVVCPAISAGCPRNPFFDGDADFESWTPRAVIRYQLDDNSNVYASYSKGFKSGLISLASPFNTVDPEKIDAYEVGYKTARDSWRLDTAAYYYDYRTCRCLRCRSSMASIRRSRPTPPPQRTTAPKHSSPPASPAISTSVWASLTRTPDTRTSRQRATTPSPLQVCWQG